MMVKMTKVLMAIWIITLGFSTAAWTDGAPPPNSLEPPTVREYPLIEGYFTVTYSTGNPNILHVEVSLEYKKPDGTLETKNYDFAKPKSASAMPLCDYQNLSMDELIHKYRLIPQNQKVHKKFGLDGIPVITELKISNSHNCNTNTATIGGSLKIRVLHPPPPQ